MSRMIGEFVGSLMRSLGFLTRLPVKVDYYKGEGKKRSDAGLYPLVGGLIGGIGGIIFVLSGWLGLSPWVASLLAIAGIITLTGGLHEDGLSDVADGFFAPKAYDASARLAIMKDSHIGVFGVLALILVVGLRVALLTDMTDKVGIILAAMVLILAETLSRAGMVALWPSLPNVSSHSIARTIGAPDRGDALKACLIGVVFLLVLSFVLANFMLPVVVGLTLGFVLSLFRLLCRHKIGGLCGDVLGASQQIGLIVILLSCAVVV